MSFIAVSFTAIRSIASQQLIHLNITYPDKLGVKTLSVSEQLTHLQGGK